ncbi:DUF4913 domain-containing protein [Luteipulveratus mongoliensis]|uniref:DUF4913 domain-containing protein n=1 Tax=Luteipulveratus mongoliensis TaxID=571913 RepID=UPI00316AEA24
MVGRLTALWKACEHLRLDPATGPSVMWRDHMDHHMSVMMSGDVAFAGCSQDKGRAARSERKGLAVQRSAGRAVRRHPARPVPAGTRAGDLDGPRARPTRVPDSCQPSRSASAPSRALVVAGPLAPTVGGSRDR